MNGISSRKEARKLARILRQITYVEFLNQFEMVGTERQAEPVKLGSR